MTTAQEQMTKQLTELIKEYGAGNIAAAAEQLTQTAVLSMVPVAYNPVIAPDKLRDTVLQLEAATQDIVEKAKGRENVYGDQLSLLKRKRELETEIELKESEAIMSIRGEGRSQYAMVGSEKVPVSNEETRKALSRMAAKEERQELARVESELMQLDRKAFWAKDEYDAAVKAGDLLQAKAAVQAGLLNMLGKRV